jgi:uncharacterized membrane protein (DUF2068 family)
VTAGGAKTPAVRLIIAYKLIKAVAGLVLAAVLFYGASHGLEVRLAELARRLREHAVHPWSLGLTRALAHLSRTQGHQLWWLAAAAAADALLTAFEGWALAAGVAWGPWVVVIATASLLPIEVVVLVRHATLGRVVVLAINLAIVIYLVREQRARRAR